MGTTGPEDMLAAALRAQAGSAPRGTVPAPRPTATQLGAGEGRRIGVGWILLLALFFGLLGGVIAGYLSTL